MDGLTIRPARPSEACELTELALRSKAYWGYAADELELWRDELTITGELIGGLRFECAVVGDRVVGFYALSFDSDSAEIEHLWVEPVWIGRGIGGALFDRAVAVAREQGMRDLRVVADPHAVGFYVRMGTSQVGEHPSVPPGRMLPVMSKLL